MQQYQLQLQQFANQQHPYTQQPTTNASHQTTSSNQAQGGGSAAGQQAANAAGTPGGAGTLNWRVSGCMMIE
jgi:hypothetical protein